MGDAVIVILLAKIRCLLNPDRALGLVIIELEGSDCLMPYHCEPFFK